MRKLANHVTLLWSHDDRVIDRSFIIIIKNYNLCFYKKKLNLKRFYIATGYLVKYGDPVQGLDQN